MPKSAYGMTGARLAALRDRPDRCRGNATRKQCRGARAGAHPRPELGRLEIMDGHVGYIDQKRKLDLSGTISTATGQAGEEPEARLSLTAG